MGVRVYFDCVHSLIVSDALHECIMAGMRLFPHVYANVPLA
jgi:hypothetical protein